MVDNDYNFTATDYEQIDEFSNKTGKVLKTKDKADYKKVLTSCPIGNLTVIYNVDKLGKFVHISPGVTVAGNVEIYDMSWVGIGSTIVNNIKI